MRAQLRPAAVPRMPLRGQHLKPHEHLQPATPRSMERSHQAAATRVSDCLPVADSSDFRRLLHPMCPTGAQAGRPNRTAINLSQQQEVTHANYRDCFHI